MTTQCSMEAGTRTAQPLEPNTRIGYLMMVMGVWHV